MFIATLVADGTLTEATVREAAGLIGDSGGTATNMNWLDAGRAADIRFTLPMTPTARETSLVATALSDAFTGIDVIVQLEGTRKKALLIADMDSTMITVECIDELADYVGVKAQVAEVTERAMRGEIDFADALRDRVALLAGLPESVIAQCLRERVGLTGGARTLVQTLRANGGHAILISGGFTHFAEPVADAIGFDRVIANRLVVENGALTGEVVWPIVDADTKRETLIAALAQRSLPPEASIAIGDGANDIPMIEAAGLGVAFHAKPKTQAAADASVRFGDLSVILYAMGYPRAAWVN